MSNTAPESASCTTSRVTPISSRTWSRPPIRRSWLRSRRASQNCARARAPNAAGSRICLRRRPCPPSWPRSPSDDLRDCGGEQRAYPFAARLTSGAEVASSTRTAMARCLEARRCRRPLAAGFDVTRGKARVASAVRERPHSTCERVRPMSRSRWSSSSASCCAPERRRARRRIGSIIFPQTRRAGPMRRATSDRLSRRALFHAHDLLLQECSRRDTLVSPPSFPEARSSEPGATA